MENNQEDLYGYKTSGPSPVQDNNEVPVPLVKYEVDFYWNYILRIKNNSSKKVYNIKIEKVHLGPQDYLEKLDPIVSLKDGELISLKYPIRNRENIRLKDLKTYQKKVPKHLASLEVIMSYCNESRRTFYTRFVRINDYKRNYHLFKNPN